MALWRSVCNLGIRRRANFLVVLFCLAAGPGLAEPCAPGWLDLRGGFGQVRLRVDLADDEQSRARGLMFVRQMPENQGMLFAYETPRHAWFWMRNTLIPLDMLFADEAGVIRRIHANAVPLDETPIDGGAGTRYVLEINGGRAAALGLRPGDQMRHPAIAGPDVAWACE